MNLLSLDSLIDSSFVGSVQQWFDGSNAATDIDTAIRSATGGNFIAAFNSSLIAEMMVRQLPKKTPQKTHVILGHFFARCSAPHCAPCHGVTLLCRVLIGA